MLTLTTLITGNRGNEFTVISTEGRQYVLERYVPNRHTPQFRVGDTC